MKDPFMIKCMETKDLDRYLSFINRLNVFKREFTIEQIKSMYLDDPSYDMSGHFLLFAENELIGEALARTDRRGLDTESIGFIDLNVLSRSKSKAFEKKMSELVKLTLRHLRIKGVKEAELVVPSKNRWFMHLFEKSDVEEVGKSYELAYDMTEVLNVKSVSDYAVRHPSLPLETTSCLEVINKSFSRGGGTEITMTSDTFERLLNYPGVKSDILVAVSIHENDIVGIVISFIDLEYNRKKDMGEGVIEIIGVVPRARRKGIGSMLIQKELQWMVDNGVKRARTYTSPTSPDAVNFFTHLGFNKIDEQIVYRISLE
ncbi:MAG: GNAT family N-acetyltransferase [Candidatus Bathyarchaeia archaeon]|nr:GNAT family N-acetyltransferase [Candidatus Bathyarchaeia archaeon]